MSGSRVLWSVLACGAIRNDSTTSEWHSAQRSRMATAAPGRSTAGAGVVRLEFQAAATARPASPASESPTRRRWSVVTDGANWRDIRLNQPPQTPDETVEDS